MYEHIYFNGAKPPRIEKNMKRTIIKNKNDDVERYDIWYYLKPYRKWINFDKLEQKILMVSKAKEIKIGMKIYDFPKLRCSIKSSFKFADVQTSLEITDIKYPNWKRQYFAKIFRLRMPFKAHQIYIRGIPIIGNEDYRPIKF